MFRRGLADWKIKAVRLSCSSLRESLERNTELSFRSLRPKLTPIYWLAVLLANFAAWGFEHLYANAQFDTLYYRLAACSFAIPLFLTPFPTNSFLARIQRIYFVVALFLLLPVLFSWNGLANAAYARGDVALSGAWLTEYALAVFLFMGLFSKPLHSLVISYLALTTTSTLAYFMFNPVSDAFWGTILFMVATILTTFFFLLSTHQQLNYVLQHRLETAYSIGSRIAHELRTPLLSMKNFASAANKIVQSNSDTQQEPDSALSSHLDHILREIEFSNRTIDILLVSTSTAPFNFDPQESFSVTEVVSKATSSYPYSNTAQRQSVVIRPGKEFVAIGPSELVVHSLYNLIKNALLAVNPQSNTAIEISWEKVNEKGIITVTDNGLGIPLRLQRKVFDDFFTTRNPGDGTGLGLAFCKSLMSQIGGKITYQRTEELSIFRMSFLLTGQKFEVTEEMPKVLIDSQV